jgi:hypothetical protein
MRPATAIIAARPAAEAIAASALPLTGSPLAPRRQSQPIGTNANAVAHQGARWGQAAAS